jgi:hypothetical protein
MTTVSTTPTLDRTVDDRLRSVRVRGAAAALAVSAATISLLLVTKPWGERLDSGADDFLDYDHLLAVRQAAWWGMVVDGLAFAVVGLTLGLGALHLVRRSGRTTAMVGAVLTTLGGILFAMGAAAFATFAWFATAPGLAGSGRSLVDYANDHRGHLLAADMAGFAAFTVGTVVLGVAALRAQVVPVTAVALFLLLTAAMFLPLPGSALDLVQMLQMLLLIGFAVVIWRRA